MGQILKKHYYHATIKTDWGNEIILLPRDDGEFRHLNEPRIPRICVASSVAQCLISWNPDCLVDEQVLIYRTKNKENPQKVEESDVISDCHITGERWLLSPTEFVFVGSCSGDQVIKEVWGDYFEHGDYDPFPCPELQKEILIKAKRFLKKG